MQRSRIAGFATVLALAAFGVAQARDAVAGDDHHGSMRQACQTDIAKLCPDVQPGGGRILQCFRAHKDALSDGCKSALMAMLAEHRAAAGDASAPH